MLFSISYFLVVQTECLEGDLSEEGFILVDGSGDIIHHEEDLLLGAFKLGSNGVNLSYSCNGLVCPIDTQ